jgi:hypothetical protein
MPGPRTGQTWAGAVFTLVVRVRRTLPPARRRSGSIRPTWRP